MPELTYVEAARQALAEEMARDETIFVVGEGIGPRGGNFQYHYWTLRPIRP